MLGAFIVVAVLVAIRVIQPWDVRVLRAIATLRTPWLTRMMQVISGIGNWEGEVPFLLGGAWWLSRRGRPRDAGRWIGGALAGELVYVLLKECFHRPRPNVVPHLSGAGWYSFPSGHAMLAPIVWCAGIALLTSASPRRERIAWRAVAIILVAAIAFARLYLGVHYPSDVAAGLLFGSAIAGLVPAPASGDRSR